MIIKTPPLSTKDVRVVPALFKAQFPETFSAVRLAIPDWVAVHLVQGPAAPGRNAPTKEQMRDELLAKLRPIATLYDPIYRLTTEEVPPDTIATFVPDQLKPEFVPAYDNWRYVFYKDARARLKEFLDRALGGIPEGHVGVADALLKGTIKGQAALEGWTGSVGLPGFKRTVEAIIDPACRVMFWDAAWGFEATGETFLRMSPLILDMFGAKDDRLYFDADSFSWFVVFNPGGQLRVGMLG